MYRLPATGTFPPCANFQSCGSLLLGLLGGLASPLTLCIVFPRAWSRRRRLKGAVYGIDGGFEAVYAVAGGSEFEVRQLVRGLEDMGTHLHFAVLVPRLSCISTS